MRSFFKLCLIKLILITVWILTPLLVSIPYLVVDVDAAMAADTGERTHYEVLELKQNPKKVTTMDIKKSYRRLAKKYHPDHNKGNEDEATTKFQELSKAYEILSDESSRKEYDDDLKRQKQQKKKWYEGGSSSSSSSTTKPQQQQQQQPEYEYYEYREPDYYDHSSSFCYGATPPRGERRQQHYQDHFETYFGSGGFDGEYFEEKQQQRPPAPPKRRDGWKGWLDIAIWKAETTIQKVDQALDTVSSIIQKLWKDTFSDTVDGESEQHHQSRNYQRQEQQWQRGDRQRRSRWKEWLDVATQNAGKTIQYLDRTIDNAGSAIHTFFQDLFSNEDVDYGDYESKHYQNSRPWQSGGHGGSYYGSAEQGTKQKWKRWINKTKIKAGDAVHRIDTAIDKIGGAVAKLIFGQDDDSDVYGSNIHWNDKMYSSSSDRYGSSARPTTTTHTYYVSGNQIDEVYIDNLLVERYINGIPDYSL